MNKNRIIDRIFLIIMSIQTVLMGIAFSVQAIRIYKANPGNDPYTREIVWEHIKQISIILILWVLLIIACFIYFKIRNSYKENDKSKITNMAKLKTLLKIAPEFNNPELENDYKIIKLEEKKRIIAWCVNIVILIVCSIMGLCYILNKKHFIAEGNNNEQILDMVTYLAPWVIISFITSLICVLMEEFGAIKSIDALKRIIKVDGKVSFKYDTNKNYNLSINITRGILIVASIVMIIVGINNGGTEDVLQKAINICTECIGLG